MENESRKNNFDLMRLFAAILVILSHSFSLMNIHTFDYVGEVGVSIFLIVSGYLITQSWSYSPKVGSFLMKRLLRILPNFIFCILITMFIIGPFTSSKSLRNYFLDINTWFYLKNISLYFLQFSLPGVFLSNPVAALVNHSLWTLPLEFSAYLGIVVFGIFKQIKWFSIFLFLLLLIVVNSLWRVTTLPVFSLYDINFLLILEYLICFFSGALFYILKSHLRYSWMLAALCFIIFLIPQLYIFHQMLLAYLVLYIALLPHIRLPILSKNDPSYGMYLFSMPIQQTLIHFFSYITPIPLFIFSFTLSICIGLITWRYIESKVLRLKKYV